MSRAHWTHSTCWFALTRSRLENTDIIFLMAQVSMSQNYYEDAIPLLESGLAIAPQRSDLLAALGESYFMSGKVDKAIEEFQKLIKSNLRRAPTRFLASLTSSLGRFDEAKQYFQRGAQARSSQQRLPV